MSVHAYTFVHLCLYICHTHAFTRHVHTQTGTPTKKEFPMDIAEILSCVTNSYCITSSDSGFSALGALVHCLST